jgi:hypothetical protein
MHRPFISIPSPECRLMSGMLSRLVDGHAYRRFKTTDALIF